MQKPCLYNINHYIHYALSSILATVFTVDAKQHEKTPYVHYDCNNTLAKAKKNVKQKEDALRAYSILRACIQTLAFQFSI